MAVEKAIASPPKESPMLNSTSIAEDEVSIRPSGIGKRPECFSSTGKECLFVVTATMSIGMSSFLYGLCTVITAPIAKDLKMGSAEITWIGASSALCSGAFLLFFAKIADTFGRRPLLIFSMAAFSITSLATGFATNPLYLDSFCGLLGLWSAASVPPAIGILGAAYAVPSKRKNWAFACFSAGNPVGFVMGCISSGIAAKIFNWRASFYLLAIIYALFFLAAIWTVPNMQEHTERLSWQAIKKFDLFGIWLSMAGLALFCASLTIAGNAPKGWKTPYVLALLNLGLLLIFGFIGWEGWCTYPIMPLRIWRDRNFSLINIVVLLGFSPFSTSSFWLSLYMQNVLNYSTIEVALHLLPQAIAGIIVNIFAGAVLHRINNRLLVGIGALSYLACMLLLATMKVGSSYWAFIFPALIFSVIGADLQFNVANMYVLSSLPPSQQSLAGGIFTTVTKVGTAIALGITTSIYNSQSTGGEPLQTNIRPYRLVFWFCVGCCALGVCVVPFITIKTQGGNDSERSSVEILGEKKGIDCEAVEAKTVENLSSISANDIDGVKK